MALYEGIGILQAPSRTPICEPVLITATFPDGRVENIEVLTPDLERVWENFFSRLADLAQNGGVTPGTPVYGAALTPAATVVPTLDSVDENGTLSLLLDRATTTIDPATLDGVYPPDYYRFSIMLLTDATDGRLVVWDALYLGANEAGWSGAPNEINVFSFITLPSGGGFVLSSVPTIGI